MLLALALCAAQGTPSHAALHPASAELFLESPDVPALFAAYPEAPMARLFADAESLGALRKLLGRPELTGEELLAAGLGLLPVPPEVSAGALASLDALNAASFSLAGRSPASALGALVVLDWKSADAAQQAERALAGFSEQASDRWVERKETRVAAGGGSVTRAVWSALCDGSAPALAGDAAWTADAARLGPGSGALVVRGFQRRSPLALARELVPGLSEAPVDALGEILFGRGALHWRMSLAGGRFVSESFAPGAERPLASAPWLAPAPFAPGLLEEAHPQCLAVAGASFDPAGLRSALSQSLGADLSAAPLFDKLGSNLVLFVQPARGMGLPRAIAVVELVRSEGALEDVAALAQALAAGLPGTAVKTSTYKDVPFVTVDPPEGTLSFGDLGGVTPVLAVIDGRLLITNGSLSLKKEIRRRQGDEKEALGPASYPWTGGRAAFSQDSTAVLYVDWAAQVDALFGLARAFGPMLERFNLPLDLTALPSPLVFTRHMPPTLHSARRVEGGLAVRHDAGFAFETWAGLAGLGALVRGALEAAEEPSAVAQPAPAASDPAADTRRTVLELRTALTVYKLDHGAFPDALARLVEPSPSYPAGYLDGRTALPLDAWGRDYCYARASDGASCRVWSKGPDGVDQDGAGDDVRDL